MCMHKKRGINMNEMKSNCNIGQLLNDKNALLNYIQDDMGNKMGVVVGMKGKDRATPLVGWALFSEFDDGRIVMDKRSKPVREAVTNVHAALDEFAKLCGNDSTAEYIEDIKLLLDAPDWESEVPHDIKYQTVELALLRANADRTHYFVCTNPAYNQQYTDLIPEDQGGLEMTYLTYGSDYHNPYDGYAIPFIRKACRAMEYRCWRFYKPAYDTIEPGVKVSKKRKK